MSASIVKIVKQARIYAGGVMPEGSHQSYPIPVTEGAGLQLAFLYSQAMFTRPGEGYQIWEPGYAVYLSPADGRLLSLRALASFAVTPDGQPPQPVGTYPSPPERMDAAFLENEIRLYEAYDAVLPHFASPEPPPAQAADAARAFLSAFQKVAEPPLMPHYEALGGRFFGWIRDLAAAPVAK